jgi:hypothetical protein
MSLVFLSNTSRQDDGLESTNDQIQDPKEVVLFQVAVEFS